LFTLSVTLCVQNFVANGPRCHSEKLKIPMDPSMAAISFYFKSCMVRIVSIVTIKHATDGQTE